MVVASPVAREVSLMDTATVQGPGRCRPTWIGDGNGAIKAVREPPKAKRALLSVRLIVGINVVPVPFAGFELRNRALIPVEIELHGTVAGDRKAGRIWPLHLGWRRRSLEIAEDESPRQFFEIRSAPDAAAVGLTIGQDHVGRPVPKAFSTRGVGKCSRHRSHSGCGSRGSTGNAARAVVRSGRAFWRDSVRGSCGVTPATRFVAIRLLGVQWLIPRGFSAEIDVEPADRGNHGRCR